MNIDEILNMMDDMLEKSWNVPLSGGRSVIDVESLRDMIDDIRLNIPMEIKHAKAIVADRSDIISNAKEEAELIIKKAEDRARILISEDEITRASRTKASETVSEAQLQSRQIKKAASDFAERVLSETEEVLSKSLNEVKEVRKEFKKKK